MQRLDPKHRVSRWVKRSSKKWLRLSEKVGVDAAYHGFHRHGADVVVCGHTHVAGTKIIGEVLYVNSGCWTDVPSQYVTITGDGELMLRES
jgi:UDP-2,3-diacylglucosamine pyrophosphatase LpxH